MSRWSTSLPAVTRAREGRGRRACRVAGAPKAPRGGPRPKKDDDGHGFPTAAASRSLELLPGSGGVAMSSSCFLRARGRGSSRVVVALGHGGDEECTTAMDPNRCFKVESFSLCSFNLYTTGLV